MEGNDIDVCPFRLNSGKNASIDRIGGWVGPSAGLDVLKRATCIPPVRFRTPDPPPTCWIVSVKIPNLVSCLP